MALDAGSVYAILGARVNPSGFAAYDAAMRKAIGSAAVAEKSNKKTAASMGLLGSVAKGGAAAGVLAFGAVMISSGIKAAKFEARIKELGAVSGASKAQLKAMSDEAIRLGAKTGVGATKAAEALVELSKGGLDAQTSMEALKGTVALAQAGDMDLAQAATTVVKSLATFSLQGKDATMVADGLASAANKTSMDVADFAQAFAQGGAAADAAGFSFDETVNVMSAMADKFQSGSDMGTSLKTTLTQMANPTAKAQAEMDRLGISVFDSNGKIKSAAILSRDLGQAFDGLTNKEKLKAAAIIAGTDGMRTLLALSKSSGKTIREQGAATDVATKKNEGAAGAAKRLAAAWESAQITIGKGLLPGVAEAADTLATKLREMQQDGSLQQLGESGGKAMVLFADGIAMAADALGWLDQAGRDVKDETLGVFTSMLDGIGIMLRGLDMIPDPLGLLPDFGKAADDLAAYMDEVNNSRRFIQPEATTKEIKVVLDGAESAQAKLDKLNTMNLPVKMLRILALGDLTAQEKLDALKAIQLAPKVLKILATDKDAKGKIEALRGIGLPDKIVNIIAQAGSAKAQVLAFKAIVAGVPASKVAKITAPGALSAAGQVAALNAQINAVHDASSTITVTTVRKIIEEHQLVELPSLKRRAKGRGPTGKEAALVGEGSGREAVVDSRTGRGILVDGPMFMDLGPDDYVIPHPADGPSASLLRALARDLGIPGFKKGKKPKKGGRFVPKKRDPLRLPVDTVEKSRDDARQKWQTAKSRADELDKKSKEKDSGGALTKEAKAAKAKLATAKAKASRLKATYVQRKKEAAAAKRYQARIKKQEDLIEIGRNDMDLGNKRGDEKLYGAGKKKRAAALKHLKGLLNEALKHAGKDTPYGRELQKQLGQVAIDVVDTTAEQFDAPEPPAAEVTAAEQKAIDQKEAAIALASLTQPLDDDKAALEAMVALREQILGRAMGTGDNSFIADAADAVKQARDQVTNLTQGRSDNADVQAQLDQQKAQTAAAQADAAAANAFLQAHLGGGFVEGGAPPVGPSFTINTLHPGDPRTLAAIGSAAASGASLQASRPAPRDKVAL